MRILILGKCYSAQEFYSLFSKNSDNIVFSTISSIENYVDFTNPDDIVEFCEANEINFVMIGDEDYINEGLFELLSAKNIAVFSPTIEAISISSSKVFAKRFMHKNKIKTPRFFIAEKPSLALDYIKENSMPYAIRPDNHNEKECSLFCETYNQAQSIVNNFFNNGNKKIIIEDYIEGKNFSVWTLSDGYSAKILGIISKYQNDVAQFNCEFIDDELKNKIQEKFINPTIDTLSSQDESYVGILGFDFILDRTGELYLLGYNTDFFTKGFNINWLDVFYSTVVGDVFLKYEFKPETKFMLALRQKDNIEFLCANTKSSLETYLAELGLNLEEYEEAKRVWKS